MSLFVYPPVNVNTSGLASEAKQDVIISELQDIEADIEAGNAAQATEATLSALDAKVVAVDTTGKATEAKQDIIIANTADNATETTLSALNAKVTTVDTSDVTVSSSALPTGASTSANQATLIASLSNIETA